MILLFWQIFSWDRAIKLLVCLLVCERLQKFIMISDCGNQICPLLTSEWGARSVDEEEGFSSGRRPVGVHSPRRGGWEEVCLFQELSGTKFITVLPI